MLLSKSLDIESITEVFLSNGPGSYTGVRVGEGMGQIFEWQKTSVISFYHHFVPKVIGVESGVFVCSAFKGEHFIYEWNQEKSTEKLVSGEELLEVLKNYADIYGINDQRWHLLTSELSNIKSLKRDGFMLFADELPQGHAIKFILIDENGNIRKYFDGTDEASLSILKKDISHLVKKIQKT